MQVRQIDRMLDCLSAEIMAGPGRASMRCSMVRKTNTGPMHALLASSKLSCSSSQLFYDSL